MDGRGPGLVLVHGTGGSGATSWGRVRDRLTARWTVVRPDHGGSGETVAGSGPLSLAVQVAAAAEAAGGVAMRPGRRP